MQISAKRIISKVGMFGDKLFTVEAVLPRIVLAELNTHKMLSKNSASSRAIPFDKMLQSIRENPFIPIGWQKEHKGMQGSNYFTNDSEINHLRKLWLEGRDEDVMIADAFDAKGVTKQLANRLLETFMYHKVVITGTEWDNFFNLRCPQYQFEDNELHPVFKSRKEYCDYYHIDDNSDNLWWLKHNKGMAEIHMMALAEAIYDEYYSGEEDTKTVDGWSLPYVVGDKLLETEIFDLITLNHPVLDLIKISTARCARTSYTTPDVAIGESAFDADMKLHDRLLFNKPPHASPAEHPAYEMTGDEYFDFQKVYMVGELTERIENEIKIGKTVAYKVKNGYKVLEYGWCNNLRGFIPYRFVVDNGGVNI